MPLPVPTGVAKLNMDSSHSRSWPWSAAGREMEGANLPVVVRVRLVSWRVEGFLLRKVVMFSRGWRVRRSQERARWSRHQAESWRTVERRVGLQEAATCENLVSQVEAISKGVGWAGDWGCLSGWFPLTSPLTWPLTFVVG